MSSRYPNWTLSSWSSTVNIENLTWSVILTKVHNFVKLIFLKWINFCVCDISQENNQKAKDSFYCLFKMSININTDVNAITFSTLLLPIILHKKSRMRRRVHKPYFQNWSSQWYSYIRNVIVFCFVLGINIISNTSLPRSISILFIIN